MFRSISRFVYGTEDLYQRVTNEIYNEGLNCLPNYPDIKLETEHGPMNIRNYVEYIAQDGFYGGDLQIGIAGDIYNINIATFNEINDSNNNLIGLTPIRYFNNNNNENRNLMILSNINNVHFRLGYYNNKTPIDLNYVVNMNNNVDNEINNSE